MEYGRHVARRRRRRLRSIPLAMLTMKKSCMVSISMDAYGSVPIFMMLRLAAVQDARAPHVQSDGTKINTNSLIVNKEVAPRIESLPGR